MDFFIQSSSEAQGYMLHHFLDSFIIFAFLVKWIRNVMLTEFVIAQEFIQLRVFFKMKMELKWHHSFSSGLRERLKYKNSSHQEIPRGLYPAVGSGDTNPLSEAAVCLHTLESPLTETFLIESYYPKVFALFFFLSLSPFARGLHRSGRCVVLITNKTQYWAQS